jgi:hypothetical protein
MDETKIWYTVSQPQFFPLLYLLERFARVDVLVFLEESQYTRKTAQSWTVLPGPNGPFRFNLPVHGGRRPTNSITLAEDPNKWFSRASKTLQLTYGKFEAFRELTDELDDILHRVSNSKSLNDAGWITMKWLINQAGLATRVIRSRKLVPERPVEATEWMASFANHINATDYIQGYAAMKSYFQRGPFEDRGVRLWYQEYSTPKYDQGRPDFEPVVSALDPLLRGGSDLLQHLIQAGLPVCESGTVKEWRYD